MRSHVVLEGNTLKLMVWRGVHGDFLEGVAFNWRSRNVQVLATGVGKGWRKSRKEEKFRAKRGWQNPRNLRRGTIVENKVV